MLQRSDIQLKALLNAACNDVDNTCTVQLGDFRSIWWGINCPSIFTSVICFKILDHLKNLTSVWKCVEMELFSQSCLNNLERLNFIICLQTKDLLCHHPRHDLVIFGWIYQNVNYFSAIIWKEKKNKVNREDLNSCCFVSTGNVEILTTGCYFHFKRYDETIYEFWKLRRVCLSSKNSQMVWCSSIKFGIVHTH